ncbi:MAG: restriction endonuclease subunit S [Desulfobacteraceae bacterium]|nr:restriction endonuclease subunit S [Desulfobacteraceae bacterium]
MNIATEKTKKYKPYPEYKDSGIDWLGKVPEHWDVKRLKYLCSQSAIYGANEASSNYTDDGIRFLRTTDITDEGTLEENGAVFLNLSLVKDYILKDGDILLSRSGTLGRSLVYNKEKHGKCAYAGYLVRFVPNLNLNSLFCFYFTKSDSFFKWLDASVIQSTIGNVNGQKYANMPLPTPPTTEQQAIADFLDRRTSEIDELVAKKEQVIELLREKAQPSSAMQLPKALIQMQK